MKTKILGLLAVGLMAGPLQAFATPMNYTITFTLTAGATAPTAGAFTYNGALFTDFLVIWNGTSFDLTSAANAPQTAGNACGAGTGPSATFAMLTTAGTAPCSAGEWIAARDGISLSLFQFLAFDPADQDLPIDQLFFSAVAATTLGADVARGKWSVAPTAVPAPASVALLALGLAGIGVTRRRARQDSKV